MKTKLLLWGLTLSILVSLISGCNDDKPCVTCPEPDPAVVAALGYIDANRADLGLRDGVDEVIPYRVQEDDLGMTHVRCYQYYKGVRVEGGELIVHLSAALEVSSVSGAVVCDVQVDTRPIISTRAAARIAKEDFESDGYLVRQGSDVERFVFRWVDTDHLCWVMVFRAIDGIDIREYYVDAHSGAIVHWRSLIIE